MKLLENRDKGVVICFQKFRKIGKKIDSLKKGMPVISSNGDKGVVIYFKIKENRKKKNRFV